MLAKHKTARKTGKPRRIAVGERMRDLINEGLNGRTEGNLFLTPTGKAWTTDSLSAAFRRARDAAGVSREIVLYTTRHEHATEICKTMPIEDAADLLDHTTVNTTRKYRHKTPQELRTIQDVFKL